MLAKISWALLALAVHGAPALLFLRPQMTETLYGVSAKGDLGFLLVHRGALFLGIVALSLYALVERSARRPASIVLSISMIGFLVLYLQASAPAGPLRKVALVDLAGLVPLAIVLWDAWRPVK